MVIVANKTGEVDSAYHSLVRHIQTDIPIVMVSWSDNFVFNDELLSVKDYILICYCEYGWDFEIKESHIWGKNTDTVKPRYGGDEWDKFDNWVKENSFKLLFKRELLAKDVSDTVKPIDYTTHLHPIPIQTEEEFNARPLSAAYYFGRSNEKRLLAQSLIWKGATQYGYSVCDNIYYFDGFMKYESGKKYFSAHIPHYYRVQIENVLAINGLAKVGLVPHGAGIKTFRAAEVPCNSVMLMWDDNLAWGGGEWKPAVNCFKCKPGYEVETIEMINKLPPDKLHQIYKAGVETWDKYRTENYITDYLLPIINKA